jgi:hypothetical protein
MRSALAVLLLSLTACGSAVPAPAVSDGGGDEPRVASDAASTGALHVAWTLQYSNGTGTDCITAGANNVEMDVNTVAQTLAASITYYCVDMNETMNDLAPGDYLVELRLLSGGTLKASASRAATVTAGAIADAGVFAFVVPSP